MNKALAFLKVLFLRLRFIWLFIILALVVGNWGWIMNVVDRITRPSKADDHVSGEFEWFCPMDPSVVRNDDKEKCPICGMALSRRKRGAKQELPPGTTARLQLSPFRIRQAGVATSEVGYRLVVREIRTVGFIDFDERRLAHITARTAGRVDRLFIDFTGAAVKKNDPLVWLYSPDLVTTQDNYLDAIKTLDEMRRKPQADPTAISRKERDVESAKERLRLWGITDEQIKSLEETKKAETHLKIHSPIDGTVISRHVLAGQYVNEGAELYTLADLTMVWMQAEVFESDIGAVREGQLVEIRAEAYPGETFSGTISFIQPTLQAETRTVKVRVDVENRGAKLKPGMYVSTIVRVPLGRRAEVYYRCCSKCTKPPSETPGMCDDCEMPLVQFGGLRVGQENKAEPGRTYYVCTMHKELIWDQPGKCAKCGGMVLEKLDVPAGQKLVFACPDHPAVVSEKPGTCPKDGKDLKWTVALGDAPILDAWTCLLHPERTAPQKATCPECGRDLKHYEFEQTLAVPFAAVIDTGVRKVVFVDRGEGLFESIVVTLGARAGEWYPVISGLKPGDRVVTAGAFLLDAESQLNPAAKAQYFGASGQETKK
ncbi:MAG: efflux RND transporter periplasmic adaptor subunit [Planctomycetes bacterium]|nr:efflux RND transporter periplasmic adaptor subunit [Planctomycetota bacterium]